ncbi:MAG: HAD family hydrolase [Clostridia bacterium]|nr:HAD family hydrolase [Clostridia bacterium]
MIKAVIFDFDGTLADTLESIKEGINLTMEKFGYPFSTRDDVQAHINHGARNLIKLSIPSELQGDEAKVDEVYAVYNEMYQKVYLNVEELYDGMDAAIKALNEGGIKMSVLSNKQDPMVVGLCKKNLPEKMFTEFRGQRVGAPTKPDPTVPLEICALMGVDPSECALVGDSDVDMKTAKNAGFTAIGVSWGYRPPELLLENGADFIAKTADDIVKIVLNK